MSAGDIAAANGETEKAIDAYRGESKAAGPEGDRAHAALVRALLYDGKIAEADSTAKAWVASTPQSGWALDAIAQVQFRKTDMKESLASLQAALAADPCNPAARYDTERFYDITAMYASAKRAIDIAHQLDPVDDAIRADWISWQPRAQRVTEVGRYLEDAKYLNEKRHKLFEDYQARLAAPATAPCRLTTPVTATVNIPFKPVSYGPGNPVTWGLDVGLEGKAKRLEIDTGASGLILSKGAAAALHLTLREGGQVSGFGDEGARKTWLATVKSVRIGGIEFENCDVQVVEKMRSVTSDGLIGGNVFSRFLLTLDFPGRELRLDPLPARPNVVDDAANSSLATSEDDNATPHDRYVAPEMKGWTSFYRTGHFLLLPVRLNDHPSRLFIVDTGAFQNLITPDAAREVSKVETGYGSNMSGLSGQVAREIRTGPVTLEFAGLRQVTNGMRGVDGNNFSKGAGVEISGYLGAPTLHQLTLKIDYRDNLTFFDYDPKRIRPCGGLINNVDCENFDPTHDVK